MKRLISDAVQVRPPITMNLLDLTQDEGALLRANLPTDGEVRDAISKLGRQMKDIVNARIAGQDGWIIGDLTVVLVELEKGELAVRGECVIERAD